MTPALQDRPVRELIRRFLQDNFVFAELDRTFEDSDSLIAHGIVDSTGFLELVTLLEQTYGITIADEDMVPENLDSIDAIAGFVARKKAA
jgi:acyl carrier protein